MFTALQLPQQVLITLRYLYMLDAPLLLSHSWSEKDAGKHHALRSLSKTRDKVFFGCLTIYCHFQEQRFPTDIEFDTILCFCHSAVQISPDHNEPRSLTNQYWASFAWPSWFSTSMKRKQITASKRCLLHLGVELWTASRSSSMIKDRSRGRDSNLRKLQNYWCLCMSYVMLCPLFYVHIHDVDMSCISHDQPSPGSCSKTNSTVHMASLHRNPRSHTGFAPEDLGRKAALVWTVKLDPVRCIWSQGPLNSICFDSTWKTSEVHPAQENYEPCSCWCWDQTRSLHWCGHGHFERTIRIPVHSCDHLSI